MPIELNLDDLNPGVWFDYDEENEAKVLLRVCAEEDRKRINKVCVKSRTEYKKGVVYQFDKVIKPDLQGEMIYDFCIMDWEGFIDAKTKEPIPCTKENKTLLMNKNLPFAKFIGDKLMELAEVEKELQEEEEKN